MREALLQNNQQLAIRLEARLQGIQSGFDAFLQGKLPMNFTGYVATGPTIMPTLSRPLTPAPALAPAPAPAMTTASVIAPAIALEPLVSGMPGDLPVVTALAKVFTVRDIWKEWKEGIAGRPAVRELEET